MSHVLLGEFGENHMISLVEKQHWFSYRLRVEMHEATNQPILTNIDEVNDQ